MLTDQDKNQQDCWKCVCMYTGVPKYAEQLNGAMSTRVTK
jgi:hypothetical protein